MIGGAGIGAAGAAWAAAQGGADVLLLYKPGVAPDYFNGSNALATYRDSGGTLQAGATDTVRDGHYEPDQTDGGALIRTTLIEEPRNLQRLTSPFSPATQTETSMPIGHYVLFIEGTGSVEAEGASDGVYGTATEAAPLYFNVTGIQNVDFTITGTVTRFNTCGSTASNWQRTKRSWVSSRLGNVPQDRLRMDFAAAPQEMTVYCRYVHYGFANDNGARVFRFGSTARFEVFVEPARWRCAHHNGSAITESVANFPSNDADAVLYGDVMEVRAVLRANGSVQVYYAINAGTEAEGNTAGALSFAGSWTGNTVGIGGTQDNVGVNGAYHRFLATAGEKTMAQCRTEAEL